MSTFAKTAIVDYHLSSAGKERGSKKRKEGNKELR
jgi:hypothetical protein